jgi:hypothetical protein
MFINIRRNKLFEKYRNKVWPLEYHGRIKVTRICGGVPNDPNIAKGWLEKKLGVTDDEQLQRLVLETMMQREGMTRDDAVKEVLNKTSVNGFKSDILDGEEKLYVEGRQLKACLKEGISVAVAAGKVKATGWGTTKKWITNYFPEHVFIVEDTLYLYDGNGKHITERPVPTQRFVSTFRGNAISYDEVIPEAFIDFHVISDHPFSEEEWAMLWVTAEQQGLGANRSQGYGRFEVVQWDQLRDDRPKAAKAAKDTED